MTYTMGIYDQVLILFAATSYAFIFTGALILAIVDIKNAYYDAKHKKRKVLAYTGFAGGLSIFLRKCSERGLAGINEQ